MAALNTVKKDMADKSALPAFSDPVMKTRIAPVRRIHTGSRNIVLLKLPYLVGRMPVNDDKCFFTFTKWMLFW